MAEKILARKLARGLERRGQAAAHGDEDPAGAQCVFEVGLPYDPETGESTQVGSDGADLASRYVWQPGEVEILTVNGA